MSNDAELIESTIQTIAHLAHSSNTLQYKLRNFGDQSDIHDENKMMRIAADRIDELERQLAEAQKDQADAKRYRWLSAQYISTRAILSGQTAWIINVESHLPMGETFEQAIDAAIAQQKVKT